MNRKSLGGLIVLNVFLLVVLGLLSFAPTPPVQGQIRRGGDYVMVAGKVPGREYHAVYIADLNNGALLAVAYDVNRKQVVPLGGRLIAGDLAAPGGR